MQSQVNYALAYNSFLATEAYNQVVMAECIQEAVVISEGSKIVLTEFAIVDKLKALWNKFTTFINKIWNKFQESFDKLVESDRKYLTTYKAIITQRKLKMTELSMPNYKPTILAQTHAEHLDINKLDKIDDGMLQYISTLSVPQEIKNYKGEEIDTAFADHCKTVFCGGSLDDGEINIESLNMTDIYNFCYDYKEKTYKDINKDFDAIVKSADTFKRLCDELEASSKKQEVENGKTDDKGQETSKDTNTPPVYQKKTAGDGKSTQTQDPRAAAERTTKKEHTFIIYNKSDIGLSEANISGSSGGGDSGGVKNVRNAAGGVTTKADTKFSANQGGLTGKELNNDDKEVIATTASGFTADQITKIVSTYQSVNRAIMSAKMYTADKMYKDYMQIIRWHVRSYVGETGGKVSGSTGTDYSNGQPYKQEKVQGEVK